MALGKRKSKQDELFVPTAKVATGPGHPFYSKLNQVLAEAVTGCLIFGIAFLTKRILEYGGSVSIAQGF